MGAKRRSALATTPEGERDGGADLFKTAGVQANQEVPEASFRDSHDVMEIDRARMLHPIVWT
jgi:hypothetical protein